MKLKNAYYWTASILHYATVPRINGVILYVKVHHKEDNDICYCPFYFAVLGFDEKLPMYEVHLKGVAWVSWGWSVFAIGQSPRSKTRNCRYTRTSKTESPNLHHKKPNDICYSVFYFVWVGFKLNKPLDKLYFKRFIPFVMLNLFQHLTSW